MAEAKINYEIAVSPERIGVTEIDVAEQLMLHAAITPGSDHRSILIQLSKAKFWLIRLGLQVSLCLSSLGTVWGAQQAPDAVSGSLGVSPLTGIAASGPLGGPFLPRSVHYRLRSSAGKLTFSITAPAWITADPLKGEVDENGINVALTINSTAQTLPAGRYGAAIRFTNTSNGRGTTGRAAALAISRLPEVSNGPAEILSGGGHRLLDNSGKPLIAR